jgi:hypothetical protein
MPIPCPLLQAPSGQEEGVQMAPLPAPGRGWGGV